MDDDQQITETEKRFELKLQATRTRPTLSWTDSRGARSVPLSGTLLLGSSEHAPCVLADRLVSRVHAELTLRPDGVWIRDLQSRNGTWLEGIQVVSARIPDQGGKLRLGNTVLTIAFDAAGAKVPLWPKDRLGELIGHADATREMFMRLAEISQSEASVLVQGETGTGKELVVRAIHQRSSRANGPLVIVDCGALADSLIESELFGHVKGAFTGAVSTRVGAIESAEGGTVFLDEVGEIPLALQPRLLRALESKTVRRVGENTQLPVDVRFVAATHRDLESMVANGSFREDLYFRLAVLPLKVPPLRDRAADIPLLLTHFFGARPLPIDDATLNELANHPWTGNVRELRTFAERAAAVGTARAVAMLKGRESSPGPRSISAPATTAAFPPVSTELPFKVLREQWVDHLEREYVAALIKQHGRSPSVIAEAAGLDRSYLHRLLKKHLL